MIVEFIDINSGEHYITLHKVDQFPFKPNELIKFSLGILGKGYIGLLIKEIKDLSTTSNSHIIVKCELTKN